MRKAEAILYCKEKALEGWMTHTMILDIYDDNEDIPQDVIDMICYKPKPSEPIILYCGEILHKELEKAAEEYIMSLVQEDIMNDIDHDILKQ